MKWYYKFCSYLLPLSILVSCSPDEGSKEEKGPDEPAKETVVNENESLLWKISGKGMEEPSYLYGTIHIIPAEHYRSGKTLLSKIKECDRLVMEVEDISNLGAIASATGGLFLDSGQVKDYVEVDVYDKFLQLLEEQQGMTREAFESQYGRMNPFVLYAVISDVEMGDEVVSYEKKFMEEAYENSMSLGGLETLEDQMSFFKQIPVQDIIEYLIQTMESTEDPTGSEFDQLIRYYTTQNLDSIFSHMTQSGDVLMKHQDIFLDNRNRSWIPKIEEYIHEEQCFIAVGAAHLPGPNGVINLLRERGYELTPISTE